ncbi:MAG: hypothetical protein WCG99_01470 [Candidatus Berkelbacteria bacterium]
MYMYPFAWSGQVYNLGEGDVQMLVELLCAGLDKVLVNNDYEDGSRKVRISTHDYKKAKFNDKLIELEYTLPCRHLLVGLGSGDYPRSLHLPQAIGGGTLVRKSHEPGKPIYVCQLDIGDRKIELKVCFVVTEDKLR